MTPKIEANITEVRQDGSTGKSLRIIKETFIGRGTCDASYPNDVLLAARHASISKREGKVFLKDIGLDERHVRKVAGRYRTFAGDVFLIGRELFRFAAQKLADMQMTDPSAKVLLSCEARQACRPAPLPRNLNISSSTAK